MSDTAYKISVMQAFANGESIELYIPGLAVWRQALAPVWNWGDFDYRVAEKPSCRVEEQRRERIVEAYKGGAKIEACNLNGYGSGVWALCNCPVWNWELFDYRVAPMTTVCAFAFENGDIARALEGSAKYDRLMRRRFWTDAWLATANASNCTDKMTPEKYADTALAAFDKRFPPLPEEAER